MTEAAAVSATSATVTTSPTPSAKVEPKSGVPDDTTAEGLHDRTQAVLERALAERGELPEPGDNDGEEKPAKAEEALATEPDAPAAAETRAERIRRMAAEDSARYESKRAERDTRKRLADAETKATKGSAAEQELAALRAQINDEGWLLKQFEQRVPPERIADIVMRNGSPEYIAEQQAKAVAKPIQDRLDALERENAELRAAKERESEQTRAHQEVEQGKALVTKTVEALGDKAPISTAFLAKKPGEYWKLIDRAAVVLHERGKLVNAETVTLHVESTLAELFGLRESAPVGDAPGALTNKAASERASLSEDGDGLSFRQRLEKTQRAVRAGR